MSQATVRSVAALILFFGGTRIDAQNGAGGRATTATTTPLAVLWSGPTLTPTDLARLRATLDRAHSLARANQVEDAEALYWSVVAEQRVAEEYPAEALRQIATMYFSAGAVYSAANVLMELAQAAAEFGDESTRLHALFDAALLYRDVGRADRVAECVARLRPLLKSPTIPPAVKAEIASRIVVR